MATAAVDIPVKVKGLSDLQKLEQRMKALEGEVTRLQKKLPTVSKDVEKLGRSSTKASAGIGALVKGFGKLAAGFAAVQTLKSIGQVGIDSIEASRRLKALSGAFGEVQAAELAAARAAEKFGLSQREASKQFAQIYARLRPIGIEIEQIETAFNGFNTAARLSGASAQESSSAWLQLSQALGSGVLRGEELNSVFEQTPTVVQAIAKEMNAPIGQIRQLAQDGKITSDIVLRALGRLEREGVNQLAESMNGPRQQFKNFSNSTERLSNALATTVLPDLAVAISDIGDVILALEGPIKYITGLLKDAIGEVKSLILQVTQPAAIAAKVDIEAGRAPSSIVTAFTKLDPNFGAKALFGEKEYEALRKKADEYAKLRGQNPRDVFIQLAQDRLKAMEGDGYIKSGDLSQFDPKKSALAGIGVTGGSRSGGGGGGGGARPQDDTKQALEMLETLRRETEILSITEGLERDLKQLEYERLDNLQRIAELQNVSPALTEQLTTAASLLALEKEQDLVLDSVLQKVFAETKAFQDMLLPLQDQRELLEAKLNGTEKEYRLNKEIERLTKGMSPEFAAQVEEILRGNEALRDRLSQMQQMERIWSGIGTEITGVFDALIEGTDDWNAVLTDTLKSLSKLLLNAGLSSIGQSAGKDSIVGKLFGGFRADGGPVSSGKSYIVGEQGPELFVPGSSGRIVPNDAGGGVTVINNINIADGKTTSSTSGTSEAEAAKLARMMEASTMAVITRERRPGGLLGR